MKKTTFWKDIRKSFALSKGRFISIMLLMFLGSFALTGLKATPPDMERTARAYLDKQKTMDLAVISNAGLDKKDKAELDSIKDVSIEYGYMVDTSIKDSNKSMRVFSDSKDISLYDLVSGKFPQNSKEIALSSNLKDRYKVGDKIEFKEEKNSILKGDEYEIVGFVNSAEIWSTTNLGNTTAGDGTLSAYGVVSSDSFSSDVYTIARLKYDETDRVNSYSDKYSEIIQKKQEQLDDLLSDNGEQRLVDIKKTQQSSINSKKAQLEEAKSNLAKKREAVANLPETQLNGINKEFSEAQDKINEAEEDIKNGQNKIDSLEAPSYNTYTRTTFPGGEGYRTYESIKNNIGNIGNLFPVVLYLVAALVTFTTMTRFVNEERINSGILKALGYSDFDVLKKFICYGTVAGFTGTLLGIALGQYVLPSIVTRTVSNTMIIGGPKLYFYCSFSLLSLIFTLISAVMPTFLVARKELNENTAQLLLPKPPVSGSKILLERIGFIWNGLNFTQKVTARNIFRYKQRMMMTVLGVTGSVALLFAGLGIQSSIGKVVNNQFKEITRFDILAVKKNNISQDEQKEIDNLLKSERVNEFKEIHYKSISEKISGQIDKKSISVISSDGKLDSFITLRNTESGKELKLSNKGALISQKLADYYNVKKGEYFNFKDNDGKNYKIKVADIVEMNVGHYIFMSNDYYHKTFGEIAENNAYLINLKNKSASNISNSSKIFLDKSGISALSQNSALVKTVRTAVNSLGTSMTVLVVVSVLLAIVILYNLTNINVAERIRELSTIKVLGFFDKEVTMYIYRETMILSAIGILLGIVGGYYLHNAIITMMSKDTVYPKVVELTVYFIPVTTIILILSILGFVVNFRLKNVNMLEALKSVD